MRTLISISLLFFTLFLNGQDLIILKNGDEIQAKVKEVDIDVIKYVKFDNLNGPTYSESKANVFMIKYENGSKDVFNNNNPSSTEKNIEADQMTVINKDALEIKAGFFSLRYFEGNNKISKAEFVGLLRTVPEAYEYYTKHRSQNIFMRLFRGGSMIGALIAISFVLDMNNSAALTSAVAGSLSGVLGRFFRNRSLSNLELAVLTYNLEVSGKK